MTKGYPMMPEARAATDAAYANAAHIPDGDLFPARWRAKATAFRSALGEGARLGLRYGPGARQVLDLFLPGDAALGVLVFVHGGYWMAFGREDWSHLAAGALARGWACALPSYTLCPDIRIAGITAEIGQAVTKIAGLVAGPVVLTGHSAGGHLVARMACADSPLPAATRARLRRVVPISGLGDLRPLVCSSMNDTLHLSHAEALSESPALLRPAAGLMAHVWVGGAERPAFIDQSRRLATAWDVPLTIDAGRHHFDVIDALENADSPLMRLLLAD